MSNTIHRVPQGSGALTANCGHKLGDGKSIGIWGDRPGPASSGWEPCARGCWPKHRDNRTPEQIKLRDATVPLYPGRHRAEVAA